MFQVYVVALEALQLALVIYLFWLLVLAEVEQNKAFTKIFLEYNGYTNVLSTDLVIELSEKIAINKHGIKLIKSKQLPSGSIYSLCPVELETRKAYIKIYQKIRFIQLFKSQSGALIVFPNKHHDNFRLYIHYQGLINLPIKKRYSLLSIG